MAKRNKDRRYNRSGARRFGQRTKSYVKALAKRQSYRTDKISLPWGRLKQRDLLDRLGQHNV